MANRSDPVWIIEERSSSDRRSFLKVSCTARSVFGWHGLGCNRVRPNWRGHLPTVLSCTHTEPAGHFRRLTEAIPALTAEVILIDRPAPDVLGYLLAVPRLIRRTLEPGRHEWLEASCSAWASEYDFVFLTRIDPAIPLGCGRDPDLAFRSEVADALAEIVARLLPGRHILDSRNVDEAENLAVAAFGNSRQSC